VIRGEVEGRQVVVGVGDNYLGGDLVKGILGDCMLLERV